jgi:hypothetical protein
MSGLKSLCTFEKLNGTPDPLTAEFRYVADYRRKYLCGLFGPAVSEIWENTTYPDLMREIRHLEFLEKTELHNPFSAPLMAFGRSLSSADLKAMAEKMARELDF